LKNTASNEPARQPEALKDSTSATKSNSQPNNQQAFAKDQTRRYQAEAKELQKQIAKAEGSLTKLLAQQDELNAALTPSNATETAEKLGRLYEDIQTTENKLLEMMEKLAEAEDYLRDRESSNS
jgi:uncharacterized coiled-coil DUF342 family protein